jgi:hypothetical protein
LNRVAAAFNKRPLATKGASHAISQFFLFLEIVLVLRQVEPRPGVQQEQQAERAEPLVQWPRQRQQRQPQRQQPFLAQLQQVSAPGAWLATPPGIPSSGECP